MTDLLVLGAGPAGVAAARTGAARGARVTLVERGGLGGTCVHAGCIPSGALHRTVAVLDEIRGAGRLGLRTGPVDADWGRMQAWMASVVERAVAVTRASLEAAGVDVVAGNARFVGPGRVEAAGRTFDGVPTIVATGASSVVPRGEAAGGEPVLTNDGAMALQEPPGRLLVAHGARFGLEWADLFNRLGSQVTVLLDGARALPDEDADIAGFLQLTLEQHGVRFASKSEPADGDGVLLFADSRVPNTAELGVDAAGIEVGAAGEIRADGECRTSISGVFAAGDVTGPPWLSNRARAHGVAAATNALGGSARVRPERIPRSVNTHPELAAVGLTEEQAAARGIQAVAGFGELATSLRGITLGEDAGALKLVVEPETGEILGAHMVGVGAVEVIAQVAAAMELEADYRDLARVQHLHPSLAELVTEAIASL